MIGGQVRDHGHMGAAAHIHQLEGAELHDCIVLRVHLIHLGEQRRADIAPQPHGFSGGLEHFGDEGGGGSLSVGTGDRQ